MKILRNKKLLILSITAVALLTLTLGVSYAYFTATVTGNESAVVTKIVAGILDVDFTITDRISNDNIILIKDEKREEKAETLDFTVSNNGRGTLDAVYYVYLTDLNITNNLKSQDFKWELIKNDDTVFTGNFSSAETNTDFTITSETNNGIVIPVKQELSVGQVDRYKLRIWLSETDADQNSLLNGSFSGKVRVTSTQLTGSEKYVVFKDQSGTQLGKKIISDGKTNYTMDISSVNLTNSTNIYCNNGGIPTITSNTLNIGGVTNNVECKISNDIMDTMANQLTTSKTGIAMTNTQNNISIMTVPSNKEVVFDLNGKEINNSYVNDSSTNYVDAHTNFRIYGTMTINDSVGTGGVYTGPSGRAIIAANNSNIIINGGSYNGRQAIFVDDSNAYVEVNGGNFTANFYSTVELDSANNSNSEVVINGGNFTSTYVNGYMIDIANPSINNTLTINGGTFNSDYQVIRNNCSTGTVNINGGDFTSVNAAVLYNNGGGTINVEDGTFKNTNNYTSAYNNNGTMNISGGSFENSNKYALHNNANGTAYVTGGTFRSENETAVMNSGVATISNGDFRSNSSGNPAIYNTQSGNLTINNGTFRSKHYTVSTVTNTHLTINGGNYESSNNCTINTASSAVATLNGGTYKSYNNSTIMVRDNSQTTVNAVNIQSNFVGLNNYGDGTLNVKGATVDTNYTYAIRNYATGILNICSVNLLNSKAVNNNSTGYIYYHTNAFGSVTPTFSGTTANIQIKDSVCS